MHQSRLKIFGSTRVSGMTQLDAFTRKSGLNPKIWSHSHHPDRLSALLYGCLM